MLVELTERYNRTQTKLISDPKDLYRFLANLINLVFANDEVGFMEVYS